MKVCGRLYNLIKEMMRSDRKTTNNEKARWEWHESADLNRSSPREVVFYFVCFIFNKIALQFHYHFT